MVFMINSANGLPLWMRRRRTTGVCEGMMIYTHLRMYIHIIFIYSRLRRRSTTGDKAADVVLA